VGGWMGVCMGGVDGWVWVWVWVGVGVGVCVGGWDCVCVYFLFRQCVFNEFKPSTGQQRTSKCLKDRSKHMKK